MRNLVVIGLGELGKLFGAAALRAQIRVTPITRRVSIESALRDVERRTPILVAVGEKELLGVLEALPEAHRDSVILLQNELFPSSWQALSTPTIMVPWVLQKRGLPSQLAGETQFFGPQAPLVRELLEAAAIPGQELRDESALLQALVDKYTFILTINTLGTLIDRTLGRWLQEDATLVWDMCEEAAKLGEALCGARVDRVGARAATEHGMRALSDLPARGRTARERVERAYQHAKRLNVSAPILERALAR